MKNIKKISALLLLMTLSFLSCDQKEDDVIFDGVNGQTLTQFSETSASFPLMKDQVNTMKIEVLSTTKSSSDRAIKLSVIDSITTAIPAQYMISDLVIPADSYVGEVTITANYDEVPDGVELKLSLNLAELEGDNVIYYTDKTTIELQLFRFCAFDINNFVGTFSAVEDGSFTYDIESTLGPDADQITLTNLYDTGGETIMTLDGSNPSKQTASFQPFKDGGVLYVSGTYGNVYAVSTDKSTISSCALTMDLTFVRQVDAGTFTTPINVKMTKK